MKIKFALFAAAIALFVAVPGWAGTLTFDLSNCSEITSPAITSSNCPNADLGTNTATYTVSGVSITAKGFSSSGTGSPNDLYVKQGGAGEDGLGLNGTSDNEINPNQYIYLNLSQLAAAPLNIHGGELELGSVQAGEVGKVCATSAVGTQGTLDCVNFTNPPGAGGTLSNGADVTMPVNWTSTDHILSITATRHNVLVGEHLTVSTTPTPEPGSLVLSGLALAALALIARRRKFAFGEK